jgi:Co/Zn/Cd efflux system component
MNAQRRVLWIALLVNGGMFLLEVVAGHHARSSALRADALDFLADAGNYAVSLFVVAGSLRRRANAALLKGLSMGAFGAWVLIETVVQMVTGTVPRAEVMGMVGALALVANLAVLVMLLAFRRGDSNMRSVWICTRNDVAGNVAVLLAAAMVAVTAVPWPDILVALGMAALGLWSAREVIAQARDELRSTRAPAPVRIGSFSARPRA